MSQEGNLVGVVSGYPLLSPASATGRQNKIRSIVDVPAAGCWDVVAEWNGHRATFELSYQSRGD